MSTALPGAIAYTAVHVPWSVVNAGTYATVVNADKAVQLALIAALGLLVRRD